MLWKKDKDTEKKFNVIHETLKKSFANVKRDTSNIFQWLNYFYRKIMEQEQRFRQLQSELSYVPKTGAEIRRVMDNYYPFESMMSKIRQLDEKIDELAKAQMQIERYVSQQSQKPLPQPELSSELKTNLFMIEKRLENLEGKKISIKEKLMRRLTRNSKEYIKSVILSYIKKYEKISALQLKEIVVDEQSFCSKSTFYRLLEELEELDDIGIVKHGKEKHYFSKAVKHI